LLLAKLQDCSYKLARLTTIMQVTAAVHFMGTAQLIWLLLAARFMRNSCGKRGGGLDCSNTADVQLRAKSKAA
jgi:predicted outer membrane repeat protein